MAKSRSTKSTATVVEQSTFPVEQLTQPAETVDIDHEEVATQQSAMPIMTIEARVKQAVGQFDIAKDGIKKLEKKYGKLEIAGVDDKAGYQKVKDAWNDVKEKRLRIEQTRKDVKNDYLKIGQGIDEYAGELRDQITPLEKALHEKWKAIDQAKEDAKKEKERQEQARLDGRVDSLKQNGMGFNGSYYVIGETISLDVVTLKEMPDVDFDALLVRVKAEDTRLKEAQALKDKEEQDRQRKLKEKEDEQAEMDRKLKAQQDELDRKQREQDQREKDQLAARTKLRGKLIEALGMSFKYASNEWQFGTFDGGRITVKLAEIEPMDETAWDEEYNRLDTTVKNMKEAQALKDKEREEQVEKDRKKREEEAEIERKLKERTGLRNQMLGDRFAMRAGNNGYFRQYEHGVPILSITYDDITKLDDVKWSDRVEELTNMHLESLENETRLGNEKKQAAEAKRLAALSDKDRLVEYLQKFDDLVAQKPDIQSEQVAEVLDWFWKAVSNAGKAAAKSLEAIK